MSYYSGASSPIGTVTAAEDLYLDSAPNVWFGGTRLWAPDSDGFYWGLTGSVANPVYKIGCFTDFVFKDVQVENDIQCDSVGVIGTINARTHVEVTFTLQSLFPFAILSRILRVGAVTLNAGEDTSKMGIGDITNKNTYYPLFFSRVYDTDTNAYFSVTLHRTKFVNAWELNTPYGQPWNVACTVRGYADDTIPVAQKFGTMVRWDPTVL